MDLTDASTPVTTSHILSLPAELLNRIIEFAVIEDDVIELDLQIGSISTTSAAVDWSLSPDRPALSQTCRALSNAVNSIYFNENAFFWWCHADDYGTREYPLEQIDILKEHLGEHAKQLRHFYFTIEYVVRFTQTVARRNFEIRAHKSQDGTISCERFSLGGFNPIGMNNKCRDQCCACDLTEWSVKCQEQQYNLLELAEEYFRNAQYDTIYRTCASCGLPENQKAP